MNEPMEPRRITIGFLGAGGYGRSARAYFRNTGEYDLVACMDVDPVVASLGARQDDATSFTNLDAFLASNAFEAVSINTPVHLHAEHMARCLEAGKHVFVTKPVTDFPDQAAAIVPLARDRQRACMVGHHARHGAVPNMIRDILDSGRLGRLCNVVISSCSSTALNQTLGDWRALAGKNPGGPLLQCGIHTIDFLQGLLGPVVRVTSMVQDDITEFEPVDNAMTLLAFENGVQAAFICNYTTAYLHTTHFLGTKANLHVHRHITGYSQCEVYLQDRASGVHEPWQALRIPRPDDGYPDDHGGILEKSFAVQIRTGKMDYTNLLESISALRVVHAAVESARTGKVALCDTSAPKA